MLDSVELPFTEVSYVLPCKRIRKHVLIALSCLFALFTHAASGQTYETTQPPGNNFDQARFRLWIPQGLRSVKAVLVLVPGSNGDGRGQVDLPIWRDFAEEQGVALVGLHLTDKVHEDMFIEHYVDVAGGSGDAFLTALEQLGAMSDHAEISTAPLLLWGMSAGGEFNYEFALWRPERVAAFVVNKGGIYYSALASAEARQVPGLFFIGTEDLAFRNDIIRGIYSINRRAHALWALIEQSGVGHTVAGSDTIAAAFYRDVLEQRLTSDGLGSLSVDSGYFCDPGSVSCIPAAGADAPRVPVSWLATDALTKVWQEAQSALQENE